MRDTPYGCFGKPTMLHCMEALISQPWGGRDTLYGSFDKLTMRDTL